MVFNKKDTAVKDCIFFIEKTALLYRLLHTGVPAVESLNLFYNTSMRSFEY